jgi:hypothetical protein
MTRFKVKPPHRQVSERTLYLATVLIEKGLLVKLSQSLG